MTKIPLPTIGEILQEEFMIPLDISPATLSINLREYPYFYK